MELKIFVFLGCLLLHSSASCSITGSVHHHGGYYPQQNWLRQGNGMQHRLPADDRNMLKPNYIQTYQKNQRIPSNGEDNPNLSDYYNKVDDSADDYYHGNVGQPLVVIEINGASDEPHQYNPADSANQVASVQDPVNRNSYKPNSDKEYQQSDHEYPETYVVVVDLKKGYYLKKIPVKLDEQQYQKYNAFEEIPNIDQKSPTHQYSPSSDKQVYEDQPFEQMPKYYHGRSVDDGQKYSSYQYAPYPESPTDFEVSDPHDDCQLCNESYEPLQEPNDYYSEDNFNGFQKEPNHQFVSYYGSNMYEEVYDPHHILGPNYYYFKEIVDNDQKESSYPYYDQVYQVVYVPHHRLGPNY